MNEWPPPSMDDDLERADDLLGQADALLRRHRGQSDMEAPRHAQDPDPAFDDDDDLPILTDVEELHATGSFPKPERTPEAQAEVSPSRAEPAARLELRGIQFAYADGEPPVIDNLDLAIEPGEVVALLGPSGCGKTTLLRLIAGLEAPDEGSRIAFGGTDVTRLPIEQRGIGMVFQHYALFPQMTVAANIGYGLKIRNVPEAERRRTVGELVDLVRLQG